MTPSLDPARFILIAHIVGAHGLKGEVRMRAYFDDPEALRAAHVYHDPAGHPFPKLKVIRVEKHQRGAHAHILCIAKIDGVGDRTAAEALKGQALYLARGDLPKPAEDTYYVADVVGLGAYRLQDGTYIGQVKAIENYGAGPLLNIEHPETYVSHLVPFRDEAVPTIDLDQRRLVVDDVFLL